MTNSKRPERIFAVVPAAGVGRRMGSSLPKQYLPLLDRTVLEQTLETLLNCSHIQTIVVVVAADDNRWQSMSVFQNTRVTTVIGGAERSDSVLNGLQALADTCHADDWVLVHDVARPCIELDDINSMLLQLGEDDVGGLLAIPCIDTIKRAHVNTVIETVDRKSLWQAQTPQMFRYHMLSESLAKAVEHGLVITDEASAIEAAGYQAKLVEGSSKNIKITRPEDLQLAEFYLQKRNPVCE